MAQTVDMAPEGQAPATPPDEWPHHALWTAELLELIAHAARDYRRGVRPAETHRSP